MYMHIIYIQIETGNTINSPVEIKLSGDGAPFHRSTSYILLSFHLLMPSPSQAQVNNWFLL